MTTERVESGEPYAVTPSDSTNLPKVARGFLVGVSGNIALVTEGGTAVTLTNVVAGVVQPARFKRVNSTNTTATGIVAFF